MRSDHSSSRRRRILRVGLIGIGLAAIVFAASAPARAESAAQADWCAGGGVPGPVGYWAAAFAASDSIGWRVEPGQLVLGGEALANPLGAAIETAYNANCLRAGDIDGDGDPDFAGSCLQDPGTIVWWRNEGGDPITWTFFTIESGFTGARGVAIADFDGDGRADVAATGFSAEVAVYRNLGGDPITWDKQVIVSDFDGGHRLVVADFDDDGDLDLAGAAYVASDIRWWRNDGGAPLVWTETIVTGDFDGAVDLWADDIDGDGRTDIVGGAYDGDAIAWWRNDGGTPIAWTEQVITTSYNGAHSFSTEDIDNDGDTDIVSCAYHARDVTWWRNDGGSPITWTEQLIDGDFIGAANIRVGDLDADGDIDVVAAGQDPGRLSWYENVDGVGGSWTLRDLRASFSGAWPLAIVDVDQNGLLDVACAAYYIGKVRWWSVAEYKSGGALTSSILDAGGATESITLDWDADLPAGTSLSLEARASDNPAEMGAWSAPLTSPGAVAGLGGRYLQYRVTLATTAAQASPIVDAIEIGWQPAAAVGAAAPGGRSAWARVTNPARRAAAIHLRLGEPGPLTIETFDAAGRLVWREAGRRLAAGEHVLTTPALSPGCYLYRLIRPGGALLLRGVVVD
jgi:hypothetical protein